MGKIVLGLLVKHKLKKETLSLLLTFTHFILKLHLQEFKLWCIDKCIVLPFLLFTSMLNVLLTNKEMELSYVTQYVCRS